MQVRFLPRVLACLRQVTAALRSNEGIVTAMSSPALLPPSDAVRIAQRARRLVRSGRLSHTAYCVLDNLLWSCRTKNASNAVVSYNALAG